MDYIPRQIDETLTEWAASVKPKPLILRGARQTGKSFSIKQFGRSFDAFIELNLERRGDLRLVNSCEGPGDLLPALKARHNITRWPGRTLLFFDEIQESPEAVQWLRFLKEDHPELFVIAAGSLMEVRLQERGFSFPVGRVTFRTLHPLTYFEFLRGTGHDQLAETLTGSLMELSKPPEPVHAQALDQLAEYLFCGGMPEAVSRWSATGSPAAVNQVQADLLQAFAQDLQKYRGIRDLSYLEAALENLRHHYGTRFRYENFAPGYRSAPMKTALGKLEGAMLLRRAWPTSSVTPPVRSRPKSAPKLLPLDVGLARFESGLRWQPRETAAAPGLDALTADMFVGQQLAAAHRAQSGLLHFWVREGSRANAEVDYLLEGQGELFPVEVKSGAAGSLKSLHQFLWRSGGRTGIRLHTGRLADERFCITMPDGELEYRLLSLPIYMAELLPGLLESGAGA